MAVSMPGSTQVPTCRHLDRECRFPGQRAGCEFNVVLGLCVGHDSLFFKHAQGLTTVLVAKDRVLAHNPIGALNLADTYYSQLWGPDRPEKPPKIPVEGRRKNKET